MMKTSHLVIAAGAALMMPAVALAAQEPTAAASLDLRRHQLLVDAEGGRIARIASVDEAAGIVTFIYRMKLYQVPISTLSVVDGKVQTSLTKKQIGL